MAASSNSSISLGDTAGDADRRQSDVVDFMRGLRGRDHPALNTRPGSGVLYDSEKKRWVKSPGAGGSNITPGTYKEIYKDCFKTRDDFLQIVNRYRQKRGQEPLGLDLANDWEAVEASLTQACDVLDQVADKDKEAQGFSQKIREAFRAFCRNAGNAKCFIALIPSDFMCSSVLCAGLQTLFSAMEHAGYHRNAVYKALERLPEILNDRAASLKILGEDEEMHRRMANLYVATLKTLQTILTWFLKNSLKAGIQNLMKPTGASDKLNDRLEEVKLRAEQVKERALVLSQLFQDESMQLQYETLSLQNSAVHMQNQSLAMQNQEALDIQEILRRTAVLNDIALIFQDTTGQLSITIKPTKKPKGVKTKEPSLPKSLLSTEELLERFEYEPLLIRLDCVELLKIPSSQVELDENRMVAMVQSFRLRSWMAVDESATLLVNGRFQATPKSEVSYVCAKLVESLIIAMDQKPSVIALAYFCGQHRRLASDVHANPSELIMSLMLQLIDNYHDYSTDDLQKCLNSTDPRSVESICESFERLVKKLPRDVFLFVVIDGLSFFADPPDREEETAWIVSRLLNLQREPQRATIKLMFACPTKAAFVQDLFEEEEIMNLPRNPPSAGRWSESHWKQLTSVQAEDGDNESFLENEQEGIEVQI